LVSLCILCFTRKTVKLYDCRPASPSNTDGFEMRLRLVPSSGKLIKPLKKRERHGSDRQSAGAVLQSSMLVRRLLEEGLDFWFRKTGDPRLNS